MKVEFLKSFSKDLDNVNIKAVKQSVIRQIELMERFTPRSSKHKKAKRA